MLLKLKILFLILLQSFTFTYGQITLSGFVKDAKTGEVLIGAYVINNEANTGTVTDNYGYFSISCKNKCALDFSYIGYKRQSVKVDASNDSIVEVLLISGSELNEVVISAQKYIPFNVSQLSVKEIQNIPSLGGSPDVLKAMQLLPGIQSQSESSSMLIVRGGDPGQNLYLLDNAPLIYVNHLGGFMSVFNPDMINDISIFKGGFPAEYGGRLSSIVNIAQRSGDTSEFKGSFGIGITDVNLSLEGRLGKNASYIFTGRKTLFDILLYSTTSLIAGNSAKMAYGFHDINGKVKWNINNRNNVYFNLYQGDDYLNIWSKDDLTQEGEKFHATNIWGNMLISSAWNYVASPKLFVKSGISYTGYRLKDGQKSFQGGVDSSTVFTSSIQDISFRSVWNYNFSSKYTIKFGLQESLLKHTPYELKLKGRTNFYEKNSINSIQSAVFIENRLKPTRNIDLNIGLRTFHYAINDFSKIFLEPRINATFNILSRYKLNLSYMHASQTSHLLFASGNGIMSSEVWIPANEDVLPAYSKIVSVGLATSFGKGMFDIESTLYYKNMDNLATYKDGYLNLKNTKEWYTAIESGGKGVSYGVELFIKKNTGKWTGSIGYNWSYTTRKFDNINNGEEYLYDYHRPHSLSLMLNRKLNNKWSFNAVWVYQTGLPYTPVLGRQYSIMYDDINNGDGPYIETLIYGERNSERMKDYHRLDIGFNYTKLTKKRKFKAVWSFSIYNVYSRQNPNMYYYDSDIKGYYSINSSLNDDYKQLNLYQVSLFPFIPSISYKVYFNKSDYVKTKTKRIKSKGFKDWLYYGDSD